MGYYDNYLEHKDRAWKKHKYISREKSNGKWYYHYEGKVDDITKYPVYKSGQLGIGDTKIEALKDALNDAKSYDPEYEYNVNKHRAMWQDPDDEDYFKGIKSAQNDIVRQVTHDLHLEKEKEMNKRIFKSKIKIAENILKKKVKDLFDY